jgi:uncharacterized membrane protein
MNDYPEAVAKIANDYLDRVKLQLRLVPARERDEFLKEIQSHVYEAYLETPGGDEVGRILAVLRRLGEPAELVADRLPGTMVRSGTRRNLPLHILAGILIALFGIPLGIGGVAVLAGVLLAVAGIVAAFYATMGAFFAAGAVLALFGLIRMYHPELWDRLVAAGLIHVDGDLGQLLEVLSPWGQGLILIVIAAVFVAGGLGMFWAGKYLLRGLRFLFNLIFDWTRQLAQGLRRKLAAPERPRHRERYVTPA